MCRLSLPFSHFDRTLYAFSSIISHVTYEVNGRQLCLKGISIPSYFLHQWVSSASPLSLSDEPKALLPICFEIKRKKSKLEIRSGHFFIDNRMPSSVCPGFRMLWFVVAFFTIKVGRFWTFRFPLFGGGHPSCSRRQYLSLLSLSTGWLIYCQFSCNLVMGSRFGRQEHENFPPYRQHTSGHAGSTLNNIHSKNTKRNQWTFDLCFRS